MRGVHVANLEPGPLAGQAAGPQRGQPPLVRYLGQRVGLVHELRQLAGTEEFLEGRGHRLVVDEFLRHERLDVLETHAFLDRPLHAHQPDAELIFDQFADGPYAAVAQMVDVVRHAAAVLEFEQIARRFQDVLVP